MPARPERGEVWWVNLEPVKGHEQGGATRPAVVVSADAFNQGPAGLVIIAPVTRTERGIPLHVRINPPEGGLSHVSFAMCEQVRCVSLQRLGGRCGMLRDETMRAIEDALRVVQNL